MAATHTGRVAETDPEIEGGLETVSLRRNIVGGVAIGTFVTGETVLVIEQDGGAMTLLTQGIEARGEIVGKEFFQEPQPHR